MKKKRFLVAVLFSILVVLCMLLVRAATDYVLYVADKIPYGKYVILVLAFCGLVFFVNRWLKEMSK